MLRARLATGTAGAAEKRSIEEALARLPEVETIVSRRIERLRTIGVVRPGADILDIGAAQGQTVLALNRLGFAGRGVEPYLPAVEISRELGALADFPLDISEGIAEHLPFPDESFDVVLANSVLEHVTDLAAALSEAHRVLRPGGMFWFLSASAMCPVQGEIDRFPLFPWYPRPLKLRVMDWAIANKPELVGYTTAPAIYWWTPRMARRALAAAGFQTVHDRWQIRLESEIPRRARPVFRVIKSRRVLRDIAEVAVPCCAYAAVK
jgi:SAM-dependent methyltransferase